MNYKQFIYSLFKGIACTISRWTFNKFRRNNYLNRTIFEIKEQQLNCILNTENRKTQGD